MIIAIIILAFFLILAVALLVIQAIWNKKDLRAMGVKLGRD